jgi:iron complex transport system substrate-binding protein
MSKADLKKRSLGRFSSSFFPVFYLLFINIGFLDGAWASEIPQRLISMSPNFTEILYDIGAQNQLIGVTDFCRFPPEAQLKEKVGGYYNPNIEKIVSLKPDRVLLLPFHSDTIKTLQKLNIPVFIQDDSTLKDVFESYDRLGRLLGREKQAGAAKKRLQDGIERIRQKAQQRKTVSILFVVGHDAGTLRQMYAAGPRSFVDEIIILCGGKNIMAGSGIPYPLVSKEQLIGQDPDVIVDSMPSDQSTKGMVENARKEWNKVTSLKAVREHHIYYLTRDEDLIPGPTLLGLAQSLDEIFDSVSK